VGIIEEDPNPERIRLIKSRLLVKEEQEKLKRIDEEPLETPGESK